MTRLKLLIVASVLLPGPAAQWVAAANAASGDDSPTREHAEFFEKSVRPILVQNCQKCHGAKLQKGGLRLDSRQAALKGGENGPVIVPGKPAQSELVRAINYGADGFQMPPTRKLDPDSIAALTEWVRLGAPWPAASLSSASLASGQKGATGIDFAARAKHWSFQPLRRTVPPRCTSSEWARNPIDCYLAARLQEAGLTPAPRADKRTLLRRVTLDLTGLPPTPREIHDFLADESPAAYEAVVDRLLASPRYGVRWGRHWLDLVRYAETYGHEFDFDIPAAWPYRDYVVRAFNDDLPYDAFVTEHVAGDLLEPPRRNPSGGANESVAATAFWWFGQAKHSPVDLRAEECDRLDNQIDVFGKAFLGLSIACARCHDHKFDPIRAADYYALAGFLQSSREQVAFVDDPAPVDQFERERRACVGHCRDLVASLLTASDAADRVGTVTLEDDPVGILLPWRLFESAVRGPELAGRRSKLVERLRQQRAAAISDWKKVVVFEDFASPRYAGWQVSGRAFGAGPSKAGDFMPGTSVSPVREFAPSGAAHSGLISPRLRGALRSRTFTIDKPFIHYRAYRRGSKAASRRALKSGQINLIVDGFQLVRDPLYGGLSLHVPPGKLPAWHTQDVSKSLGARAFIEIVDEDEGWIAVDSIVFSDNSSPPRERPNPLIQAIVEDPAIDSRQKLAARYTMLFAETLDLWKTDRLASDPSAPDRVAVLNWLCRAKLNPADPRTRELNAILTELHRHEASLPQPRRVVALADGSAEDAHILTRGNPQKLGPNVPRRFLEVFGGQEIAATERGSGRLQLAGELTGSAKVLLARVFVNRLWHHHFGRGLVNPPDDFGKMGQPPTHPELLDSLAAEFLRGGWSVKRLQRMLVLSAAYRMASEDENPKGLAVDPDDRLLWRMRVRRLEAEAIRDSILAVSGRLDERMEGPSIPVHLTEFMTGRGRPDRSGPLDGNGRRSIYLAVRRNFLTPMFLAFDFPTPFTTAGRRGTSNVPAQALALLNNPFVVEQSRIWASRACELDRNGSRANGNEKAGTAARIDWLYESAFGRLATAGEKTAALQFVTTPKAESGEPDPSVAWSELCHVLFNVQTFVYVH